MIARPARPTVSLVLEQTLGHRTHAQNIERVLSDGQVAHAVHHVDYRGDSRIPWAVRASTLALRETRTERAGVTFFHTQAVSLFAPLATRGRPYVVSVDATPIQVDAMGRWYQHAQGPRWAEATKRAWYQRVFGRATALVAWSAWAADSLRTDYGVCDVPIEVFHPGAPETFFSIERPNQSPARPTVLFVGGDFERKGGPSLLRAFERLRGSADLVLVTDQPVDVPPGVRLAPGIRAGSEAHRRVFAEADLFCLPTLGDCTPLVLGEAMAAGLPILTTSVGSNSETVGPDAGVLVPPGDDEALASALARLVEAPTRLREMGHVARERAAAHMNADRNAEGILSMLTRIASGSVS